MEGTTMDLLIMKEPISRLQAVEDAAVQALDFGDHDRALFLRMQALALAKLCMDDPIVGEKDTILAKAHLQLSATYLGMGFGDQAYWHAQRAMDSGDPRRSGNMNPGNSILLVAILLALARAMLMRMPLNRKIGLEFSVHLTSHKWISPRPNFFMILEPKPLLPRAWFFPSGKQCIFPQVSRGIIMKALIYGPSHEYTHGISQWCSYKGFSRIVDKDPSNAPIHEAFGDLFVFARDSGAPMIENDSQGMRRSNKKQSGSKSPKSPKTPTSPTHTLQVGAMDEANQDYYERGLSCYDKAWELINKSVNGTVKRSGRKVTINPALAQLYAKIAKTRAKQGRDVEATDMYEKAITSHDEATVPNGSAIAHLNYELGCTYHRLKKYNEAKLSFEKAAKFCDEQKDIGRSDPLALLIQKEQGINMYDKGEYEMAKLVFEELSQLQRQEYGGGSVLVAETLKYLGDCAVGLRDMPEACHCYNRAVRIMKRKYGAHDPNVRDLVYYIRQLNVANDDEYSGE